MTMHEGVNNIIDRMNRMDALKMSAVFHLKNYVKKLETDDYDPNAVDKMKAVNELIKELQEEM